MPTPAADTLVILLPGALMTLQHYVDAGFPAALTQAVPGAELQLTEIDVNQLDVPAAVAALHRHTLPAARQRGYRRIVLGGISLGATVALHYARLHGDEIDGLCLLAPYPGSRLTTNAIRAAGGLTAWHASEAQLRDDEFQLWHWLAHGVQQHAERMPIYLGYGRDDRFADGLAMMAAALPAARVHTVPGGHDWPAWSALWQDYVANSLSEMISPSLNTLSVRPPIKSGAGSEPVEGQETPSQASTSSARTDGKS